MPKLLLHTCCAPCLSGVLFQTDGYAVTSFYYNPNIPDEDEYSLRLNELTRYCESEDIECIEYRKKNEKWNDVVSPYAHLGERSRRCYLCYRERLEAAFQFASENSYDAVGTVLSVSPHKVYKWIREIGMELSTVYGVDFYDRDFKKNNGFLVSVRNSEKFNFYRQTYCGCIWSARERSGRKDKILDNIPR